MACALESTSKPRLSGEELAWVERIERRRAELTQSSAEVEIIDYGCGSPEDVGTREQMERGRRFRRTVGNTCHEGSKGPREALLLFELVRALVPDACLELGTSLGISAAYQAAALELNGRGRLITIEGAPALADFARSTMRVLGLDHRVEVRTGRFEDILPIVLRDQFDFAFVDGHHEEQATLAYFDQIVTSGRGKPVVIAFDDIAWSRGMSRAWGRIRSDPRTGVQAEWHGLGLALAKAHEVRA